MSRYYINDGFAVFTYNMSIIRFCLKDLLIEDIRNLYNRDGHMYVTISDENYINFRILTINRTYYHCVCCDNGGIMIYELPDMQDFFGVIFEHMVQLNSKKHKLYTMEKVISNTPCKVYKYIAFIGATCTGKTTIFNNLDDHLSESDDDQYVQSVGVNIHESIQTKYINWIMMDFPGDLKYVAPDELVNMADIVFVFGDPTKCPNKIPTNKQVEYIPNVDDIDAVINHIENTLPIITVPIIRQMLAFKYVKNKNLTRAKYVSEMKLSNIIIDDILILLF